MQSAKADFQKRNTIFTIFLHCAAYTFMYYTYHNPQLIFFLPQCKFKSSDDKLNVFLIISLTVVLIVMFLNFISFVMTRLFKKQQNSYQVVQVKSCISYCLFQSFAQLGLFGYILTHGKFGLTQVQLKLISHWILICKFTAAIGQLLRIQFLYSFKQFAFIFASTLNMILMAQVFGYNIFQYF